MAVLRYVTHPQVRVSADAPVQRWGLSDIGRARAGTMLSQPWLAATTRLLSSDETKALETAAIIATATGLAIEVRSRLTVPAPNRSSQWLRPLRTETIGSRSL